MDKRVLLGLMGSALAAMHQPVTGLPEMRKGVHRVSAGSKAARQMASQNKPLPQHGSLTQEQIDWNAQVEAKRKEKKNVKA